MAPPLINYPTFTDTFFVHTGALDTMSYDIDTLCQIATGKPAESGTGTKPTAKVNLTSNQNILSGAGGTTQIVAWDQALIDTDGMWNSATPTLLTVTVPGWYRILIQAMWNTGNASDRIAQILVNGTADPLNVTASSSTTMAASGGVSHQCHAYEHLNTGATIYGAVYQASGSTVQLLPNGIWGTYMVVTYADPY